MKAMEIDTEELVRRSLEVIQTSPADCLSAILSLICNRLRSDSGVILTVNRQSHQLALDVLHGYPAQEAREHRSERLKLPIAMDRETLLTMKDRSVSAEALLEAELSGGPKPVVKLGRDITNYPITLKPAEQVMGYAVETMGDYVAVLTLEKWKEKVFDRFINPGDDDKRLLETCSNLISVALAARQSLVFKFDELIKGGNFTDFVTLGHEVVSWVLEKFKVNSCAIYSIEYDRNTNEDYVVCKRKVINGRPETDLSDQRYPLGKGYCGWVAAHNASLILTEFENEDSRELGEYEKWYGDKPTRTGKFRKKYGSSTPFKSYLGVPLHDGKNLVGVLEVLDTERDYAFSDEGLLEMIGYRVALEYNRISMDKRRESLFEIPRIETSDTEKVIRGVVDAAMNNTSATHGFFMYKDDEGYFSPQAVRGYRFKKGDIGRISFSEDENKQNLIHKVMSVHDYFLCQNIKDEKGDKYLVNSMMPAGFIPDFIRSLLMVPVYLIRPGSSGSDNRMTGDAKEYEDLGVLILMSSKINAFQRHAVSITDLADKVATHVWANRKLAELASEREQISELKQAIDSYALTAKSATASAGTVHTARRHIKDVSETITKLTAHQKIRDDKELLSLALHIEKQFQELQKLYDRLHDVFGGIQPNLELCDLAALVQEVRAYMEPTFRERRIEFRSSLINAKLPRVKADPILAKVVFINLITNSIEAGARNITVRGTSAKFGNPADGIEGVEIVFADDGIGIAPDDWKRVFDAFITNNKKGGTGLGLAVNREILDRHRGEIKIVRSNVGVGQGTEISVKWRIKPPSENNSKN